MKEKKVITATIVLYNEEINELSKTINSFLNTPLQKKLFLIDNSPKDKLRNKFNQPEIEYIFIGENIGFGSGHNTIINKIKDCSKYHLILNPDVSFESSIILNLIKTLEKEEELAMIAPKVIFPNGEHQYTCRKYPTVLEMISRKMGIFKNYVNKREYKNLDLTKTFYPDFIHGCFQLYKTEDFVKINGFDERYFLYMEDVDICRKIDVLGKKKMYYPKEEITHILKKGSSKSIQLFIRHFLSSVKYFYKWR
ncbi:MAG: glycosyl transferase family 2 [Flavobacteriaceae bacterium]|nr:glycosyl transferase family 2 [Flavobacteriaceae bacterium]